MGAPQHGLAEYADAFQLGITKIYRGSLKRTPVEYRSVVREVPAKHFYDTDWHISGLGIMPEKEVGGSIDVDKIISGNTKRHEMVPYALSIIITHEAIYWDLFDVFKPLARMLPKSAVDRYNLVAYSYYANAFNSSASSKYLTVEGEAVCSTSHARLDGGTWSNRLADDDSLSYEGIQEMLILARRLVDDRGLFVKASPKWVIVAPEQEWVAETVLNSTLRPMTANNDMNTLKGNFQCHSSSFLTSANPWFMQCDKRDPAYAVGIRLGENPDLVRESEVGTRNRVMSSYCSFDWFTMQPLGLFGSNNAG